jgi:prepilin-type N-terminal cleavage/methylation domain-containing protein
MMTEQGEWLQILFGKFFMKKGGFTLIEIVITVLIVSVAGLGYLQTHSNSIRAIELLDNRMRVNEFSSFIFSNIDIELHNKKKSVKEFIEERYSTIDDDDLLTYLKEKEFEYTQDELYFMNFGENEEEAEEAGFFKDVSNSDESQASEALKRTGILVELVTIRDDNNNSTSIYHFSYLE